MGLSIKSTTTNVMITGVGGQGVIMISKILALLCQGQGHQVKQSEVHGMAKRGGAVFSHVRFGEEVWSPTIPAGEADVLLALEWAEGMRWLHYLNPETGTFISDTHKIVPPFACRDRGRGVMPSYAREAPADIISKLVTGYALNATGMARALGNERAANTVLLGVLSTVFDFTPADWLEVVEKFVPKSTMEINRQAFLDGCDWVSHATVPDDPVEIATPGAGKSGGLKNTLEITPQWCKGCDICVKFCPERCLVLNSEQLVELARPDDCTGCRLCEWLCPDFAIKVRVQPADLAAAEA